MSDICIDIVSNHVIRAYDISANGIDVVSVHKLFAYRFMSTARIDVVSGHIKYCRLHMVSQDSRCMGDGRMHYAPFCYHGYVPLRCGGGGGRRYGKWNKSTTIWLGQVRTSVPDVCNCGYVPLSHLGHIVMRTETTTSGWVEFEICRIVSINCNYITKDRQVNTQQ